MNDKQLLERITVNPKIMVGKPIIKGTRLTVEYIIDRLAHHTTVEQLMEEYPGIMREDVDACLLFAKESLSGTDYIPLLAEAS